MICNIWGSVVSKKHGNLGNSSVVGIKLIINYLSNNYEDQPFPNTEKLVQKLATDSR